MKIKINLLNNKISAEGVQGEQVNKVIDGFFNFLNGSAIPAGNEQPVITSESPKAIPVTISAPSKPQQVAKEEPKKSETPPASKVLPKIDDQRTLKTSIGELVALKPSNIRETEDGTKLYQTHYTCDCGHTGKRFIRETNDYTKCHECGDKLLIEPATLEEDKDGIPMPDIDGNFFIARELYERE